MDRARFQIDNELVAGCLVQEQIPGAIPHHTHDIGH